MTSTSSSSTAAAADISNSSSNSNSRTQSEARAAVFASLQSAGSAYDTRFQQKATDLHTNALAIAAQENEVKTHSAALAKESVKWEKEVEKATKGLREFGDVQNWAEVIEREFLVLEETLRLVEGEVVVESASGGSGWR
ncbi:hypothetical protein B0A50_01145 [Salinomyces thailandicus]|uniref:Biogenesis of lysosome-related organelles complex 1 subunit 1 n=1 Tax=Salinomyces thailandicus TaxID=706561 RepID=A0A4V5N6K1_9PEZI|nr:hypothetical protein B0A50_01145 [Salinomyces thailandica]